MSPEEEIPHGILVFQKEQLVFANHSAGEITGCSLEELFTLSEEALFGLIHPEDQARVSRLRQTVASGNTGLPELNVRLIQKNGDCHFVDAFICSTLYKAEPAVQVIWIDNTPRRIVEESLLQHIHRLQVLRDIDHAILSIQGAEASARAALKHIPYLVPNYRASSVILIDLVAKEARLLAFDFGSDGNQVDIQHHFALDELAVDFETLKNGQPYLVENIGALADLKPLQQQMAHLGINSYLVVPLFWGGELIGMLNLASSAPNILQPEHTQIIREVADSLAVAIQQARLNQAEQQRRREAELMRDVMAALASAGNLKQTLEVILVNLHNMVNYDRAGLFLADENERYVMANKAAPGQDMALRAFQEDNPIIAELQQTKRPIVVADVQVDARFSDWPDLESVRSWLGAPLLADDKIIGVITLGSLQENAYSQDDIEVMQVFASQVAEVLRRATLYEETSRRTEELEVLSTLSFALGKAESGEVTLSAIVGQISKFLGAAQGVFLFADRGESTLTVRASQDESVLGLVHPLGDDLLWQVYSGGQMEVVADVSEFLQRNSADIYHRMWSGVQSAVVIPLKSGDTIFSLLCLAFERNRGFSSQDIRLYHTVAEITGTSIRRAVVLEALERQVNIRTQHLSTLYNINAIASEPLELQSVLEQVLDITLDSMKSKIGAIHFVDERGGELYLVAHRNLPANLLPALDSISLTSNFWSSLIYSTSPMVMPNLAEEPDFPVEISQAGLGSNQAYIGAPIRAKGQILGLLSLFGESILDYSIEDITLFMTIADQIGSSVERARLMKQAELAAVVEERQRLARELHDSVTQLIYGQVLFAGAGLKVLKRGNLQLAEQHLERIDQAAQRALKEMRLLVYQLRPSDLLDDGLTGALERRLESVEKRTGLDAQLLVSGQPNLDESTELALYRIAEEALNNTLKHAEASSVLVKVLMQDDKVILEVSDDGRGFNLEERKVGGGMGLTNMHDRALALNGELEIISRPGEGTRVIVSIEALK